MYISDSFASHYYPNIKIGLCMAWLLAPTRNICKPIARFSNSSMYVRLFLYASIA